VPFSPGPHEASLEESDHAQQTDAPLARRAEIDDVQRAAPSSFAQRVVGALDEESAFRVGEILVVGLVDCRRHFRVPAGVPRRRQAADEAGAQENADRRPEA
jgi:hypothetical protein